jgi:hypothetical protein
MEATYASATLLVQTPSEGIGTSSAS